VIINFADFVRALRQHRSDLSDDESWCFADTWHRVTETSPAGAREFLSVIEAWNAAVFDDSVWCPRLWRATVLSGEEQRVLWILVNGRSTTPDIKAIAEISWEAGGIDDVIEVRRAGASEFGEWIKEAGSESITARHGRFFCQIPRPQRDLLQIMGEQASRLERRGFCA
jgi:hypothetical protein